MEQFYSLEEYSKSNNLDDGIITLAHKTQSKINCLIVLIEGVDDRKIYENFFKIDNIDLQPCDGCINVVKRLSEERKAAGKDDVIAILDSDFRKLEKPKKHNSYIFYTDCHDMEMTILCDSALCLAVYKKANKDTKRKNIVDLKKLRKRIEWELYNLSMLKWYNMHKALKFIELEPDLHDIKTLGKQLDLVEMSTHFAPSKTCIYKSYPIGDFNKFAAANPNPDLDQLTNGHDYLCRWASILKYESSFQISNSDLRKLVEEYYTPTMARRTGLYKRLSKWASNHNREIMA